VGAIQVGNPTARNVELPRTVEVYAACAQRDVIALGRKSWTSLEAMLAAEAEQHEAEARALTSLATFLRTEAIAELPTHSPVARAFVQYAKGIRDVGGRPGRHHQVHDRGRRGRLAPSFTPVLRVARGATPVHDRECHDRDEEGQRFHSASTGPAIPAACAGSDGPRPVSIGCSCAARWSTTGGDALLLV
jgi:hypothetical protein